MEYLPSTEIHLNPLLQTNHFKQFSFIIINFVRKMKQFLLSILFVGGFMSLNAQTSNFYTIQLGSFDPSVKQADFEAIRSYTYIYKRDGLVFAGAFDSQQAAEPFLAKIKAKGFDYAFIAARPFNTAKSVYVIQISTKSAGEPLDWQNYLRAGTLYTMPINGLVRIAHGAYADKNDTNLKLKEIVALGFTDAFIKSVKDIQLNPISEFDTGDKSVLTQTKDVAVVNTKGTVNGLSSYGYTPAASSKRLSVIKLQDALKKLGLYGGVSDGIMGNQTQTLYDRALVLNRRLATYEVLAQKYNGFNGWEDGRLLCTIARQLSVKDNSRAIVADLFNNLPQEMLSSSEAAAALNWHNNLFKQLELWSAHGQYNDQVYSAFKAAYYHTLVHLEDEFAAKNIRGDAGTALSVSVIKILIGEDLDGFN